MRSVDLLIFLLEQLRRTKRTHFLAVLRQKKLEDFLCKDSYFVYHLYLVWQVRLLDVYARFDSHLDFRLRVEHLVHFHIRQNHNQNYNLKIKINKDSLSKYT